MPGMTTLMCWDLTTRWYEPDIDDIFKCAYDIIFPHALIYKFLSIIAGYIDDYAQRRAGFHNTYILWVRAVLKSRMPIFEKCRDDGMKIHVFDIAQVC